MMQDLSDGCGGKFDAVIVTKKFEGKPLLARHRMVNAVLVSFLLLLNLGSISNGLKAGRHAHFALLKVGRHAHFVLLKVLCHAHFVLLKVGCHTLILHF